MASGLGDPVRPGYCMELVEDLHRNLQKGQQTDITVMDFAKAFDKVLHAWLLYKLQWYGIRGRGGDCLEVDPVLLIPAYPKSGSGYTKWEEEWQIKFHPSKCQVIM